MKATHNITGSIDGVPVIEGRADEFSREWRVATRDDRVMLPDKRPAVICHTEFGDLYFTMHPEAWDRLKRLPRDRPIIANRTRLCEFCSTELRCWKDDRDVWYFKCPSCKSTELHSKSLIS